MSSDSEVAAETVCPMDLIATGRRHLAVKDFNSAVETLATACELLAKEHGEAADQCAEAYLWYGKSLLGLYREESGVLGDRVPGSINEDEDDDDDEDITRGIYSDIEDDGQSVVEESGDEKSGDEQNKDHKLTEHGEAEAQTNGEVDTKALESHEIPLITDEEPSSTNNAEEFAKDESEKDAENGVPENEETLVMAENEGEDVDNLQLAWEMLDLARSILYRRVQESGGEDACVLLADAHLALGEVALESETYEKAVDDIKSSLDILKGLYGNEDRRVAEAHYQIGLANSLAANFDDAITHFKTSATILKTRVFNLESPNAKYDPAVRKNFATPGYTIEGEIKELKALLPEIHEKMHDMMEYKSQSKNRVRQAIFDKTLVGDVNSGSPVCSTSSGPVCNVDSGSPVIALSSGRSAAGGTFGASSSMPAMNISHLIKRKRNDSEEDKDASPAAKKADM